MEEYSLNLLNVYKVSLPELCCRIADVLCDVCGVLSLGHLWGKWNCHLHFSVLLMPSIDHALVLLASKKINKVLSRILIVFSYWLQRVQISNSSETRSQSI
jgi:hypothetical protein